MHSSAGSAACCWLPRSRPRPRCPHAPVVLAHQGGVEGHSHLSGEPATSSQGSSQRRAALLVSLRVGAQRQLKKQPATPAAPSCGRSQQQQSDDSRQRNRRTSGSTAHTPPPTLWPGWCLLPLQLPLPHPRRRPPPLPHPLPLPGAAPLPPHSPCPRRQQCRHCRPAAA